MKKPLIVFPLARYVGPMAERPLLDCSIRRVKEDIFDLIERCADVNDFSVCHKAGWMIPVPSLRYHALRPGGLLKPQEVKVHLMTRELYLKVYAGSEHFQEEVARVLRSSATHVIDALLVGGGFTEVNIFTQEVTAVAG